MAKILSVAFDLEVKANYDFPDVPSNHPANKYVRALYSNGITKGDNGKFLPDNSLTRGHYSAFMYRVMFMDKNFEAKPIEPGKPTTPPVTNPDPKPEPPKPGTGNGQDTGLITDGYDNYWDVPKPPGYVAGETNSNNNKKRKEIMDKNGHNMTGAINPQIEAKKHLGLNAKKFGVSYDELIGIANSTIKTGKIYDGRNFSLYYDYNEGIFMTSWKAN